MWTTVNISDMKVSKNPEDVLITYSLGSCVGVTLYDPLQKIGGMIHCMLPLSKIDPVKAKEIPFMFVDTGLPLLLQTLLDMGADKKRIVAKVAGGAMLLNDDGIFRIGERNYIVVRKLLWKNNILISAEDVGGTVARTMILYINDGKTIIKSAGREYELK
ncbi:MAG: chemotaxis protein CheD [Candidatus Hydrogenedentes bacterium]|nr:chemotaxis protein CheD [Candidatus Hydrogenedentota bacterium]